MEGVKIFALFFLCFADISSGLAQQSPMDSLEAFLSEHEVSDSLRVKVLNELAALSYPENQEKTIDLASKALMLARKLDYVEGHALALDLLSKVAWHQSDYSSFLMYGEEAKQLHLSLGDSIKVSQYNQMLGLSYGNQGKYSKSLALFYEALGVYEQVGNQRDAAQCLNSLAFTYMKIHEYMKAIEFFQKAIPVNLELENERSLAITYNNMGVCHLKLKNFDQAIDLLQQALYLSEKIGFEREISAVLRNFSEAYYKQNQLKKAKNYIFRALKLQKDLPTGIELVRSLNLAANIFYRYEQYDSSLSYAKRAYGMTSEIGSLPETSNSLEILYKSYEQVSEYQKAFHFQSLFLDTRNSLFTVEKSLVAGQIESINELKQRESEYKVLAREDEFALVLMQEQKAQREILVILILLLAIIIIIVHVALKHKQRVNIRMNKKQRDEIATFAQALQRSNEELKRLSDFKVGLTQMIAHDMKNSLNTILGFSSLKPAKEHMTYIHSAGQNILTLVNNMLDVEKFEEAEIKLNRCNCSLLVLANEVRKQTSALFKNKNMRLSITIDESLEVDVDTNLVCRIMMNLLTNAIKYSEKGSTVLLGATVRDDNYAEIKVTDQGRGIAAEHLTNIFDKFWQLEAKDLGMTPSTGLGLTFCKMVVEAHGGSIRVESEPGKGTSIIFTLPVWLEP